MGAPWHITLFGRLEAVRDHLEVVRFQTSKSGSLLGYLAFHASGNHSRDELVEHFWPESDLDAGRHSLRQALASLRRQLEPPGVVRNTVLQTNRSHVRLNPMAVTTDVNQFLTDLHRARREEDDLRRADLLSSALDGYTGRLMPGFYEEWVLDERERLEKLYIGTVYELLDLLARLGRGEDVIAASMKALSHLPVDESIHRRLIRAYIAVGKPHEASRHYGRLKKLIRRQEDRAPEAATQALANGLPRDPVIRDATQRSIRRSVAKPAAARAEPPREELERFVSRIPARLTRFFGREDELDRLEGLLATESPDRLVTLLGPGGSGKTRLAIELARRVEARFGASVTFVSLSAATSLDTFLRAIADQLGLTPHLGQDLAAAISARFGSGPRWLLILDNFEQLPRACSRALYELLAANSGLCCLATSRQPLGLEGETLFRVEPLPVPQHSGTPERLLEFASVRMFVDRAQAVRPDFQVTPRNADSIVAICQKLEGIPLAIELAAARAQALAPGQMLEHLASRLDFLVSRVERSESKHRTLRGAIAWSYELLDPEEQRFLRALSVFRGGWSYEAASAVWEGPGALDHLTQLLDRSLITATETDDAMRYHMLESIREFAERELAEEERAAASERHGAYFEALAKQMSEWIRSPRASSATETLTCEHANLEAALESAAPLRRLRLGSWLWRYWQQRGYLSEGFQWIAAAAHECPDCPTADLARALNGWGSIALHLGRADDARDILERSVLLARQSGGGELLAEALTTLGAVEDQNGNSARARDLHEECLQIRIANGDDWGVAAVLNNLGRTSMAEGDFESARTSLQESRKLFQRLKDWERAAMATTNLAALSYESGDYVTARPFYEQSLDLFRSAGNQFMIAVTLQNLGETLLRDGEHVRAFRIVRDGLLLSWKLGDEAGMAIPMAGLGNCARLCGDYERAVRLLSAAEALHVRHGVPLPEHAQTQFDNDLAAARSALTPRDFQCAWSYGQDTPIECILEDIVEIPTQTPVFPHFSSIPVS